MLPLIPLAISLAPQIARWLFGDKAAEVTADVATAVQIVTGHDPATAAGAAAAEAAMAGNVALTVQLQQRLAEIAAQREAEANREADAARLAQLEEFKLQLADTARASGSMVVLSQAHSPLAWVPAIISGGILAMFASVLMVVCSGRLTAVFGEIGYIILGTLTAMTTQVGNFWLGSSIGSKDKTSIIASQQAGRPVASDVAGGPRPGTSPHPEPSGLMADDLNMAALAALRRG